MRQRQVEMRSIRLWVLFFGFGLLWIGSAQALDIFGKQPKCADVVSADFAAHGLGTYDKPKFSFKTTEDGRTFFNSKAQQVAYVSKTSDGSGLAGFTIYGPHRIEKMGSDTADYQPILKVDLAPDCSIKYYNRGIYLNVKDPKGQTKSSGMITYYHVRPDFCNGPAPALNRKGCAIKSADLETFAARADAFSGGWGYLLKETPAERALEAYYGVCKSHRFSASPSSSVGAAVEATKPDFSAVPAN